MANLEHDTSRDEEIARQLQAQYDQGNGQSIAFAQPVTQLDMQLNCGDCGTTHVVRSVTHGSTFYCTVCSAQNKILMGHRVPVVVGRSYSFVPVPIICNSNCLSL
ncbi:uncharacterized protein PHALS_11501 [Plasmopara halstedii]|uniref:Uncharacterized protein n=1 Tax=Plasmopara halstedii TaxID=4781 RepID=A0A0P1A654_PLAHL|nr:uncharacterized protein PHALS_11501 [Plasmopara halstedii]CEG35630.1 hypothetical protein PHALS_11501 [Plasmopara halstedii]|eukprot:XP_024571999.1 hypothetical protein PHALS_11501 [Plasmopara halstedii]